MSEEKQSFTSKIPRWVWFIIVPIGVLIFAFLAIGVPPVQGDPILPESEWGVGADNIEPAWTGLLREWPPEEEIDSEVANLGYDLFFDPLLSGDNNYSCANCHHPDLAFSDGLTKSQNVDGDEVVRHSPSLWNVAYNSFYFWDGRAETLEEQMITPLTAENELNQDPDELVAELQEIDAYADAFDALFDDGITIENVAFAIATFERTLVSDNSAFDAYAEGDFDALTAQQRRGMNTFRSAGTRCFECHLAPNFTDSTFRVIGVPDAGDDLGRGETMEGAEYAFKVPSLRNVALSSPYMHNGEFQTLDEVVEFYSTGTHKFEKAEIDRQVAVGLELSDQEKADLVAFLHALTDETIAERFWHGLDYIDSEGTVIIPDSVASGLDEFIVEPTDNPARAVVEEFATAPRERPECDRDDSNTIIVAEGQTIQSAIDCAVAGDTILVPPGVYNETLIVDASGITIRGMASQEPASCPVQTAEGIFPEGDDRPDWPILDGDIDGDGESDLVDGVIVSGNDFTIEQFIIQHYTGNGVIVEGAKRVVFRHLFTDDAGLYGVFPVRTTDVLIECNVVTGITDAGIYVGQSRDIIVRNNLAYDNVIGIELENTYNAEVYDNEAWNNTAGIIVYLLPNIHSKILGKAYVYENDVHDNNRKNDDVIPGSIVSLAPIGAGIMVMGADDSEIHHNNIENNRSFGIAIIAVFQAFDPAEIDVGALSENNKIYSNTYINNGYDPDPAITDAGFPGADILWDTEGYGNTWDDEIAESQFPPLLPNSNQPGIVQRAIYRFWNFLAHNI